MGSGLAEGPTLPREENRIYPLLVQNHIVHVGPKAPPAPPKGRPFWSALVVSKQAWYLGRAYFSISFVLYPQKNPLRSPISAEWQVNGEKPGSVCLAPADLGALAS